MASHHSLQRPGPKRLTAGRATSLPPEASDGPPDSGHVQPAGATFPPCPRFPRASSRRCPIATASSAPSARGEWPTVYLADDLKHDRKVAIKVLRPELAAVIGGERFVAEIKTTAALQHPHILSLFDSGEVDGFLYYVMPFVEGESLRDRLDRDKQLPVEEALRIAKGVGSALHYAPRAWNRPPGHQAGQHPHPRRRARGGRLRHRHRHQRGRWGTPDRDGHERGHPPLHEPRAGQRRPGRQRTLRHLRPGLRALRDARRAAPTHGAPRHGRSS